MSGSCRSLCSSGDIAGEGAEGSAIGRAVISTFGCGLGSIGVAWTGAERTSPGIGGAGVGVIGGLAIAAGAAIGCVRAGLGRGALTGRGAISSGSVRLLSAL